MASSSDDSPIPHGGHCPAERALDFLAGKWRPMTIFWLMEGPLRFNELQRRLGGVTHRTLSKTLKEMEADALLTRHDYGQIPPRVEYRLTSLGESLRPVLEAMERWAVEQRERTARRPSHAPRRDSRRSAFPRGG